jgi:hypothetical protein
MNSPVFLQLILIADMLVVRWLVGGCLVRAGPVVTDLVGTVATGVAGYRRRDLTVTRSIRSAIYMWLSPPLGSDRRLGRAEAATAHHPTRARAQGIGSFC